MGRNVYLWRVDAARCSRLRLVAFGDWWGPDGSAGSWNCWYSPLTFGRAWRGWRSVEEVEGIPQICHGLTCLGFLGRIILGEKPKEVSLNLKKSNKN